MKNKVLLVLLLSFAVSLAASAQKITMNLQQVKLEKVFSLITKQTGLTVAYSRTIVNPERIVSVQAKDNAVRATRNWCRSTNMPKLLPKNSKVTLIILTCMTNATT